MLHKNNRKILNNYKIPQESSFIHINMLKFKNYYCMKMQLKANIEFKSYFQLY